jgi:AraC-like DNA-binding protein
MDSSASSVDELLQLRRRFLDTLRITPSAQWMRAASTLTAEVARRRLDPTLLRLFLVPLLEDVRDLAQQRTLSTATPGDGAASDPPTTAPALLEWFTHAIRAMPAVETKRSCSERVKDVINDRYAEHLTLSVLAKTVGRQRSYLADTFRRETGRTIHEYLTVVRLEKARELINAGHKVEAAMLLVGYRSKKAFYRQFRDRMGITPGTLRYAYKS